MKGASNGGGAGDRALDDGLPAWAYALGVAAISAWFLSRWSAAWYAYPFEGFTDERYLVDVAHAMVRDRDANPHFFNYPALCFELLAGLYALGDWTGALPIEQGGAAAPSPDHYVWARLFVLALAALAVPLTAELGRRLVSPLAGLAAAAFLAAAPLFTNFSYLATVNPPLACFSALAGLGAARVLARGTRRDHALAGAAAGLAVGTKYVAFPAALLAPLAHWIGPSRRTGLAPLLAFAAAAAAVFLLSSPFLVLDFDGFWRDLHRTGDAYELEGNFVFHEAEGATSYWLIAARFFDRSFHPGPTLCALLGLAWLARARWRAALLAAFVPLATWAFLGAYKVHFPRNLMGALPFAAVLAGAGIAGLRAELLRALERLRRLPRWPARRLADLCAAAALAAALASPLAVTRREIREDQRVDTRRAALEWVEAHVPKGARLLREERTPPIEELLEGYDVRYVQTLSRPDRLSGLEGFDYVLLTVPFRRDLRTVEDFAADRAIYEAFMARHRLVAEFDPAEGVLSGRRIAIYEVVEPLPP